MSEPEKGTYTAPDRSTFSYEIWGKEHLGKGGLAPLVLIMGLSGVKEDWRPFVNAMATHRTTLVYDRRGIGESRVVKPANDDDEEEEELTLDLEGRDLLGLLSSLGAQWKQVHVLGWSMGGHILQALLVSPDATEHQDGGVKIGGIHILSVVLASTLTKLPRGEFNPSVLEEVMASAGTDPNWKEKVGTIMMEFQYDRDWLSSQSNRDFLQTRVKDQMKLRRPQRVIGLQMAAIAARDVRSDLPRIPASLPVLVLHGRLDRMVDYSESQYIVDGIKHASRLDMPPHSEQFGHFWYDYFGEMWWATQIEHFLQHGKQPSKSSPSRSSKAKL